MTREEIEACWRDPRNRKWCFYYCKADPRVIVPKRYKWMGWTVNAAHPSAIPVVLLLILLLIAPIRIVESAGAGLVAQGLTAAASITVMCLLCHKPRPSRLSSEKLKPLSVVVRFAPVAQ